MPVQMVLARRARRQGGGMSVKRYESLHCPGCFQGHSPGCLIEEDDGDWVRWEAYEAMEVENERLKIDAEITAEVDENRKAQLEAMKAARDAWRALALSAREYEAMNVDVHDDEQVAAAALDAKAGA